MISENKEEKVQCGRWFKNHLWDEKHSRHHDCCRRGTFAAVLVHPGQHWHLKRRWHGDGWGHWALSALNRTWARPRAALHPPGDFGERCQCSLLAKARIIIFIRIIMMKMISGMVAAPCRGIPSFIKSSCNSALCRTFYTEHDFDFFISFPKSLEIFDHYTGECLVSFFKCQWSEAILSK